MRLAVVALASAWFLGAASAAEPRWIRIQSPHFEVYSTAGEAGARDTLREFETARSFFAAALGREREAALPIRIIAFNSLKEYEPYRFNEFSTAYYLTTEGRDIIVMSGAGVETFPSAIHEYVHLTLQHVGFNAPAWLDEGLAELYSTLRPFGDKTIVGALVPGRRAELLRSKWTPLAVILAADRNSPYYNEKSKAGSLYNEGWALTHMLYLSPGYQPRFLQFMAAIVDGRESIEALTTVYGKPLSDIESDLKAYLRGDHFQAIVLPERLERADRKPASTAVSPFDVKLILFDLSERPGKEQASRQQLEALAVEDPSRPEPHARLGYLAWRAGRAAEAQEQFEQAFALGGREPTMLWDYGRMIGLKRPAEAARVLKELVALEPDRADARIELAGAQLNSDQAAEALDSLKGLRSFTPKDAFRFYSILAFTALRLGDIEEARESAQRLLSLAKNPQDRQNAQQLLDSLK